MKKPVLFLTTVLLFVSSCKEQKHITVAHVNNPAIDNSSYGFYYSLPQTVIDIEINVLKTEFTPGPYSDFAKKYLGLENVKNEPYINYEISSISFNKSVEPDPAHFYYIEYNSLKEHPNFSLEYTESGLLKSMNTNYKDSENKDSETIEFGISGSKNEFTQYLSANQKVNLDTIYEDYWVDTMIVRKQRVKKSIVEKKSEDKAKEIADILLNLEDLKLSLISGFSEIPYDKKTMEYMHTEMLELENRYLELFTGIESQSIIKYKFSHTPSLKNIAATELFRFSDTLGILPRDGELGKIVEIETEADENIRRPHFSMHSDNNQGGLYYRIPENGLIRIKMDNLTITETKLLINQFGRISRLPYSNFEIQFFPKSGALKSIRQGKTKK
ncbi:MAG: DUF4831 family protein [Bacteroidota bacterium]